MTWSIEQEDAYGRRLEGALRELVVGNSVDVHRVFGIDPVFLGRGEADLRLLMRLGLGQRRSDGARGVAAGEAAPGALVADRYELLEKLGVGSFGKVWLAADRRLGRLVALKSPRPDLPRQIRNRARDSVLQDGRSLANLRHPNIVHVNDVFEVDGDIFLCLEYVRGESLGSVLEFGALHWADGLRYAADVGEALEAVHAAGLVHRDVKPQNILWDSSKDEVKLTDFGLAVTCGESTRPGGTPLYMAPEAFRGSSAPPVDVYSLAATLFTLLSAEPPFPGKNIRDVERLQRIGLVEDKRLECIPEVSRDVVIAALAHDAAARPSLPEFVSCLRGALNQNLASVGPPEAQADDLAINVSRLDDSSSWTTIGDWSAALSVARDTSEIASYRLETGDRVRVDVQCARDGFLAVLAIGPSGSLHLLHPRTGAEWASVRGGEKVTVADLHVVPPAGRERISVLWCRHPRPIDLDDLRALVGDPAEAASPEHQATRDIVHLQSALGRLAREDWGALSVELDHRESA